MKVILATTAFVLAAVLAALVSTQAVAQTKNTNAAVGPFAWHASKSATTISRLAKPTIHNICMTSAPGVDIARVKIKLPDNSWKTIDLKGESCISVETTRVQISSSGKSTIEGNYALMR